MEDLRRIEDTDFVSARRMAGLARLAVHNLVEVSYAKADRGEMTRESAAAHIRAIRPSILKSFGVIEGFDDASL